MGKEFLVLTKEEAADLEKLRKRGVLVEIDLTRLPTRILFFNCGDGDEWPGILRYHRENALRKNPHPMMHGRSDEGGALLLQPNSPLHLGHVGIDQYHIDKTGFTINAKAPELLAPEVHGPCGGARFAKMLPSAQIEVVRDHAMPRFAEAYPFMPLCPFYDVRYEDRRQRSYVIELARF